MFKVSVKGVVSHQGRYLLRVNERREYELLGGKLEHEDGSLAFRVRQELLEESGITVRPGEILEPWFYVFGDRAVLIVPIRCDIESIPETLHDLDGGRLEWVEAGCLDTLPMPKGYLDSILGKRPALTRFEGDPGQAYHDDQFDITLAIVQPDREAHYELHEACDFASVLHGLGFGQAAFRTVRYRGKSQLEVVFELVGQSPRTTPTCVA